jgi:hypothetical protein
MVGHQNVNSNRPGGRLEPDVSEQLMRLVVSQPATAKIRANRQEHKRRDFIRIQNTLSGSFSFMKRHNNNIYLNCYYVNQRGSPGGSPYHFAWLPFHAASFQNQREPPGTPTIIFQVRD